MFIQLRTGLVLVKQGELELLHLLEVVVQHELLGEGWVEVVDGCFCSVELVGRQRDQEAESWWPGSLDG